MTKNYWRQGKPFGGLMKRLETLKCHWEKFVNAEINEINKTVTHIRKIAEKVEIAKAVKNMQQDDLKGKVISDDFLGEKGIKSGGP